MTLATTSTELSAVMVLVIVLLAIAGLGLIQRRIWIPASVVMLALGLCLGLVGKSAGTGEETPGTGGFTKIAELGRRVSPDLIIFVLLPPLVYEAAHRLNPRRVWKNLGVISALALPVLLLTASAVAVAVVFGGRGALGMDWKTALLLGVILAATDPVAVVAAFRELGVAPRLVTVVEGESLCNDGTAIVLHQALCSFVIGGAALTAGAVVEVGARLAVTVVGGLAIGALTAWALFRLIGDLAEERVEISVSLAVAYASFILAEHVVGVSGVLATLAAGLVAGAYGRHQVSPAVADFAARFWGYAAGVVNALIFFLVGLVASARVTGDSLLAHLPLLALVLVAVVAARALGVALVATTVGRLSSRINGKHQVVMIWGGLRGGVSLALALHVVSLPGLPPGTRDTVLVVTCGVVITTLLLFGTSINWLVGRLGLSTPTALQRVQAAIAEDALAEEALSVASANKAASDDLRAAAEERRREAKASLQFAAAALAAESFTVELLALSLERRAIEGLLAGSAIDPATSFALTAQVDHLEDELHTKGTPMNRTRWEGGASLSETSARGVAAVANLVIDEIVKLESRVTLPGLARVREQYEGWREQAHNLLLGADSSPEAAAQRTALTHLHIIRAEVARTDELERVGLIDGSCAKGLRIRLRGQEREALRPLQSE